MSIVCVGMDNVLSRTVIHVIVVDGNSRRSIDKVFPSIYRSRLVSMNNNRTIIRIERENASEILITILLYDFLYRL